MCSPISPLVPYTSIHALVRSSTLLYSSIVLRFLLLALLGTTFYCWDYCALVHDSQFVIDDTVPFAIPSPRPCAHIGGSLKPLHIMAFPDCIRG